MKIDLIANGRRCAISKDFSSFACDEHREFVDEPRPCGVSAFDRQPNLDLVIQWIGWRPNPVTGTGYRRRGQTVKI